MLEYVRRDGSLKCLPGPAVLYRYVQCTQYYGATEQEFERCQLRRPSIFWDLKDIYMMCSVYM
jgi:hypothetical protein